MYAEGSKEAAAVGPAVLAAVARVAWAATAVESARAAEVRAEVRAAASVAAVAAAARTLETQWKPLAAMVDAMAVESRAEAAWRAAGLAAAVREAAGRVAEVAEAAGQGRTREARAGLLVL